MKKLEPFLWAGVIAVLAVLVLVEGRRNAELEERLALAPKALYGKLARSQVRLQIVDVRTDAEEFEDAHIPGAIPFPGCDPSAASEWMLGSVPTVIVSGEGEPALFEACRKYFTLAKNLGGGMAAWSDENLPEDVGEYSPPLVAAGGGCL
jgi:rhodanese-related sulfurtransferase